MGGVQSSVKCWERPFGGFKSRPDFGQKFGRQTREEQEEGHFESRLQAVQRHCGRKRHGGLGTVVRGEEGQVPSWKGSRVQTHGFACRASVPSEQRASLDDVYDPMTCSSGRIYLQLVPEGM